MDNGKRKLVPFSARFGHATNSSSTHSVVLAPEGTKDDPKGDTWEFGWKPFVAASPEAKRLYAAAQVYEGLRPTIEDSFACAALAATLCGLGLEHVTFIMRSYLDHQSVWVRPPAGEEIRRWVDEMLAFLMRPGVAVVGGNDNEPIRPEAVLPGARPIPLRVPTPDNLDVLVRRDPVYGYWTAYNPETGARVRFRWNDDPIPPRASVPELVDLKITGYCAYECPFCYQSSGPSGKHADDRIVYSILNDLSGLGVFEVVFGGGEPTTHPHLFEFLRMARHYKLAASFTTRNIDWVQEHANELRDLVRSVGISCSCVDDVVEAALFDQQVRRDHFETVIHLVPELYGSRPEDLWRILDACKLFQLPVLFLGLKKVGRAVNACPRLPAGFWERFGGHLARVDTLFARRYARQLRDLEVDEILYDLDDSAWSCYIDAVEMTIGPNSYSPPWVPLNMRDATFIGNTFRNRGGSAAGTTHDETDDA